MRLIFALILLLTAVEGFTQPVPKREFRGAWVSTVYNIDFPPRQDMYLGEVKDAWEDLLDSLQATGINAVIMQIRPAGDAFFASPYEPWSAYLTGQQGRPPYPAEDPLPFFIEAAHARAMEFHAWFNPFRVALSDDPSGLAPGHVARQRPEWVRSYGRKLYLDPGEPGARHYVRQVVADVVRRYAIDAVHFDDYFYPYRVPGEAFPDSQSFVRYNPRRLPLEEWRRDNVSRFIHDLRDTLLRLDPQVRFGISPFGVWRNQDRDPRGSATRAGQTSYDDLYADIRGWLQMGWIDYVAPQLYFSVGFAAADFQRLLDWWRANHFGADLYIGHALYKVNNNADPHWRDPGEIPRQIALTRRYEDVQGSIFFSTQWFEKNPLGVTDSLRRRYYHRPALIPARQPIFSQGKRELLFQTPASPPNPESHSEKSGVSIHWAPEDSSSYPAYYVIYRRQGKELPDTDSNSELLAIVPGDQARWLDPDTHFLRKYTYLITAVDQFHRESQTSFPVSQRRWSGLFGSNPSPR